MKILLVDHLSGGHHQTYLSLYARTLFELGHEVTIFCPDPEEILLSLQEKNSRDMEKVTSVKFDFKRREPFFIKKVNRAYNSFRLWKKTAGAIKRQLFNSTRSYDLVFFLWLDSYVAPLLPAVIVDFVFRYPWSGLYFHPSHLRIGSNLSVLDRRVFNPDYVLRSKHCKALALLDEGVVSQLKLEIGGKYCTNFPDVTSTSLADEDCPLAVDMRKRAQNKIIVSVIGGLTKRKGVLDLLKISDYCIDGLFFVLVGKLCEHDFTPSELAGLKSRDNDKDKYFCHFERIEDEADFNSLIQASDILYAAYSNFFHSSNMLTKAAVFKKLLIVNRGYCSDERVKQYKMGLSIESDNLRESAETFNSLAEPGLIQKMRREADFDGYLANHNLGLLRLKLKELIAVAT